jgi:tRNA threonylcarbamoyl adenosine modification protein YjeE
VDQPKLDRSRSEIPAASLRVDLPLSSLAATHALGRRLAALIRPGDVITLSGALGVGKTELARALIQARAGAEIEVPSPSYTLVQDYRLPDLVIRHIDLYRVEDAAELVELDLDAPSAGEAWLIEWPERAEGTLPAERLDIELRQSDAPDARIARLVGGPSWSDRLSGLRRR